MVSVEFLRVGSCCHPEWVTIKGGGFKQINFPALAALIHHPLHGYYLFDTGYSARFNQVTQHFPECLYRWVTPVNFHAQDDIVQQLAMRGISAPDIQGIFISHFHADHVAALIDFPKAKYLALAASYNGVRPLKGIGAVRRGFLPALLPTDFSTRYTAIESFAKAIKLPEKIRPFSTGFDVFGDNSIFAIELPGHARGQMGLWINSNKQNNQDFFLVADACWSSRAFKENIPPSWLSFLLHDHRGQYLNTLSNLHQLSKHNANAVIMPSHCELVLNQHVGRRYG